VIIIVISFGEITIMFIVAMINATVIMIIAVVVIINFEWIHFVRLVNTKHMSKVKVPNKCNLPILKAHLLFQLTKRLARKYRVILMAVHRSQTKKWVPISAIAALLAIIKLTIEIVVAKMTIIRSVLILMLARTRHISLVIHSNKYTEQKEMALGLVQM
jgi:hypothetical protein